MKRKQIVIPLDFSNISGLKSYEEVLKAIEQGKKLIYTNCLDFFSFYYLDKGYDVEVIKKNGEYIVLSELLIDKENVYTTKEIRKGHDARKMLVANAFNYKSEVGGK